MKSTRLSLTSILLLGLLFLLWTPTGALKPKETVFRYSRTTHRRATRDDPLNFPDGKQATKLTRLISSRGGDVTFVSSSLAQRILKTLRFERYTASAMLALSLFCIGIYSMWTIIEEGWHLAAVAGGFQKQLPLVQIITSTALARTNGWVWWNFLSEKQSATLDVELLERGEETTWDFVVLERISGTLLGSIVSVFSYISCFLAVSTMFYGVVEWSIQTLLGSSSFWKNESLQYIVMSMVVLSISGIALHRLMDYDMLLRMWDYDEAV